MSSTRGTSGANEKSTSISSPAALANSASSITSTQPAAHHVADAAAVDQPVGVEQGEVAGDDGGADAAVLGVGGSTLPAASARSR